MAGDSSGASIVGWLRGHFGTRLTIGDTLDDGRLALDIGFGATHNPAMELAGYSVVLEVLDPPGVCSQLATIGTGLVERYGAAPAPPATSAPFAE